MGQGHSGSFHLDLLLLGGVVLGTPSPSPRAWQRDVGRAPGQHLPQAGTARPHSEGSQLHSYTPEHRASLEPSFTPQIYGAGPGWTSAQSLPSPFPAGEALRGTMRGGCV